MNNTLPEVGTLIADKYRVDGVLGEGGMGVVLLATHVHLDTPVAIKVVRAELTENAEVTERLMREARAAASIQSEHVARVMDVGRLESGSPFIVLEYLKGQDLLQVLETEGPLPVARATTLVLEACQALAEAHRVGIIHRDLKPENLFLADRRDGTRMLKVLDFGISKQTGFESSRRTRGLTNPSSAVGSPQYMPPEQMRASRDIDARADIYGLGTILFELLTGRPAFDGDGLAQVCTAVLEVVPPRVDSLRAEVPSELADVIARCLEKDRAARYQDVAELAVALAPFAGDEALPSVARVSRVVGSLNRERLSSSPTLLAEAPRTARGTVSSPVELAAVAPESKPRRGPWILAGVAVSAALLGVFFITSSPASEPTALASGLLPNPSVVQAAVARAEVQTVAVEPAADPPVAEEPAQPEDEVKPSAPRPAAKPAPAKPKPPPAAPAVDARDPSPFGGRR